MDLDIPFAIAGSAALLAGAAWFNAKTQLSYDFILAYALAAATINTARAERCDRVNLFYVLEKYATSKSTASTPFLVYNGKEWSFKEVYDVVLKHGTWLKTNYSIAPKEVIAISFVNGPHFIFFWLALWSLGANPAFINYNLTGQSLLHCIKTSTARVVFVDEESQSKITQEVSDALASSDFHNGRSPVQIVHLSKTLEKQILATQGMREPDASRGGVKVHDMANLIYTSGTTGHPKPAIVSWNKAAIGGSFVSTWLRMKQNDRFYSSMPLYHSSASLLGFCTCLMSGSTFVLGYKFSTKLFWPDVRASNASIIQYVGETCRYLLAAPPQIDPSTGENLDRKHHVRIAFGNGLRPDVWNRFKERFGIETIGEFYSATESPSGCWNLSSNDFTSGAIGRNGLLSSLYLSREIAILELDWETETPRRFPQNQNFCRRLPRGEPGELLYLVDAKQVEKKFQGYFNNPKANEGKILRDVFVKGDAWFRTGDIVRWDQEGRWFFCDRIGDTMRWKSENISTSEVSEALGSHPAVHEANVYGVELPNHDGRAGCAALVLNGEVTQQTLDSVAAMARQRLPKYAVPLFLRVVREMRATGNNKQQKHVLRQQGVEPERVREDGGGDRLFWLREEGYVPMEDGDWEDLKVGKVRL